MLYGAVSSKFKKFHRVEHWKLFFVLFLLLILFEIFGRNFVFCASEGNAYKKYEEP